MEILRKFKIDFVLNGKSKNSFRIARNEIEAQKMICSENDNLEIGNILSITPLEIVSRTPMSTYPDANKVVLTGIDISFWNWVCLMVKIAFASIPAAIIISIIYFLIAALLSSLATIFISLLH